MRDQWYLQGVKAAEAVYGTPKPPPHWSREWQGRDVPRVTKKVTIPSMSEQSLR